MRAKNHKKIAIPYLTQGVVVSNNDADQMGRLKVWIPAVDGDKYDVDLLPWVEYASPLMGVTTDYVVGREKDFRSGPVAYGFWAIPKVNAIVLVMFLNGDPNRRFYMGSVPGLHTNRGLPAGRNIYPDNRDAVGPFTDTYDQLQPAYRNLRAAFGDDLKKSEAQTRGAYERQVAQAKTDKDGSEGYAKNTVDPKNLDPQTYCLSTPGGHFLTMVDDPEHCRTRLKTISGNQIILDDANERIYISTARGGNWIELDEDGHIHMFASESFSVASGGDINFTAKNKINLQAGTGINLKSTGNINLDSDGTLNISIAGSILMTACGGVDVNAESGFKATAPSIHLNGPKATVAGATASPSIVPAHEPWTRPVAETKRNTFWKP